MAASTKWQCSECGKVTGFKANRPSPKEGGKCPSAASGNHIWEKLDN